MYVRGKGRENPHGAKPKNKPRSIFLAFNKANVIKKVNHLILFLTIIF